jgi:hypothetical protein
MDVGMMLREGAIVLGAVRSGSLEWSRNGEQTGAVAYVADLREGVRPGVSLSYVVTARGERRDYSYRVELAPRALPWGGGTYLFVCPLSRSGGGACSRRVRSLYLPPGAELFGCRHCHQLAYTSSQESHKWDGLFASLGAGLGLSVEDVREALKGLEERGKSPARGGRSRRR